MKNLFKGLLAIALLLIVSPSFAVEAAHAGSTVLSPAPDNGILGILQEGGKSQIIAALLAWFLGTLGIHLFYLGHKKKAMTRLYGFLGATALYIIGVILAYAGAAAGSILALFGSLFIIVGGLIYLVLWILAIIDLVKILTGDLQPANGSYTDTI